MKTVLDVGFAITWSHMQNYKAERTHSNTEKRRITEAATLLYVCVLWALPKINVHPLLPKNNILCKMTVFSDSTRIPDSFCQKYLLVL